MSNPEDETSEGEGRSKTISCQSCKAAGCGELKVLIRSGWQTKTPAEGVPTYFCPVCSGSVLPA